MLWEGLRCSEYFLGVVQHMFFTMFLMLHGNTQFYNEFRHTVEDDQFTVGLRGMLALCRVFSLLVRMATTSSWSAA